MRKAEPRLKREQFFVDLAIYMHKAEPKGEGFFVDSSGHEPPPENQAACPPARCQDSRRQQQPEVSRHSDSDSLTHSLRLRYPLTPDIML